MAGQYIRILDSRELASSSAVMELEEVPDLGAYRALEVYVRVVKPGSGGTIVLQHAATKDPGAFLSLAATSTALTATAPAFVEVSSFLRYVRWMASNVAGDPVVLIDIVAKE